MAILFITGKLNGDFIQNLPIAKVTPYQYLSYTVLHTYIDWVSLKQLVASYGIKSINFTIHLCNTYYCNRIQYMA